MRLVDPMTRSIPRWRVTIPYREPDFAMRNPDAPSEFVTVYEIWAKTAEEARDEALAQFQAEARQSSVGWRRVPIDDRVTVQPM